MKLRDRAPTRSDRGESLIELMFAITIMSAAFVALISGVAVSVKASTMDDRQIQAQALLKSWADKVTQVTYQNCGTTSTYFNASGTGPADYATLGLPALPSGFTATTPAAAVEYWSSSSNTFVSTCASPDYGVQRFTLRIAAVDEQYPGFTAEIKVVLRKPCATPAAC